MTILKGNVKEHINRIEANAEVHISKFKRWLYHRLFEKALFYSALQ